MRIGSEMTRRRQAVLEWAWTREGAHGKLRFRVDVRQNVRVVTSCSKLDRSFVFCSVRQKKELK
jgi:hypothetical protein